MPSSPSQAAALDAVLRAVGRRLRVLRGARACFLGAIPGLVLVLAGVVAGKLRWIDGFDPALAVATVLAPMLGGALLGGLRALPSRAELAIAVDRLLATDEAATTALTLDAAPGDPLRKRLEDGLRDDLDPADPRLRHGLPLRPPRGWPAVPALAVAVAIVFFLPSVAPPRRAPSGDPMAEAQRLTERRDALQRELGAELPEEIDRAFDDLIAALRKGAAGRAEAERKAEALDEQLEAMQRDRGDAVGDAVERARSALQDVDAEAAQDVQEAAKQGDLDAAAEAVERMRERMKRRPKPEQEKAAEALERASRAAAEAGSQDLADALNEEAEQTRGGDGSAAGGGKDGTSVGGDGEQSEGGAKSGEQTSGGGSTSGDEAASNGGSPSSAPSPSGGSAGGEGLAEYLRRLEEQGVGGSLGDEQRRREMASRMQAALAQGGDAYQPGRGDGIPGAGSGVGKDWGAGSDHSDADEGDAVEGGEHQNMNRQVDGEHRKSWVTEYGQDHAEERLAGIRAVTETVDVPVGEGAVDIEFLRRTGGREQSGNALVTAPEGYRDAADEAIQGEGIPRHYREQIKTYFDAIE